MKKALISILAALIAFPALLLIVASFQPKAWMLERSVLIEAPRDKVWQIVSDLNRYSEWNPYARIDTAAKITINGPAATIGSSYAWDGPQSGAGSMTTAHIAAGERIDFKLEFIRPMASIAQASFLVGNLDGSTKMTWRMEGQHEGMTGLIARAIHLIISMDSMVGKDFESGLATLKGIAENEGKPQISAQ